MMATNRPTKRLFRAWPILIFNFYYGITLPSSETYSTKLIEDNPSHKENRIDNYYNRGR